MKPFVNGVFFKLEIRLLLLILFRNRLEKSNTISFPYKFMDLGEHFNLCIWSIDKDAKNTWDIVILFSCFHSISKHDFKSNVSNSSLISRLWKHLELQCATFSKMLVIIRCLHSYFCDWALLNIDSLPFVLW